VRAKPSRRRREAPGSTLPARRTRSDQDKDLDGALRKYGDDGWELVSVNLDADLKGSRDGHLLVFKRAKG
jgi:hypothetical protein